MNRTSIAVVVGVAVMCLSGCMPYWTGQEMQEELDSVQAEQRAMQEEFEAEKEELTEMIASARNDVDELREVLQEARDLLQRNNADLGAELRNTREDIRQIIGRVEELNYKLERLEQDHESFKEDVDIRFAEATGELRMPDEPDDLYSYGREALEDERFGEARSAFSTIVEDFPEHERAVEAKYQLGETYFAEDQWALAVQEYRDIVAEHADSDRADDATYRIGQSLQRLDRCQQALQWFQIVVSDYPDSPNASNARQRVQQLEAQCG